jgi:type IV pilus assembly protein PilA
MQWATNKQKGFTIVELLIVVVVIAILTAITIVSYNGIQQRARASAAQALAKQSSTKIAAYYVLNNSYPTDLSASGIADTSGLQ